MDTSEPDRRAELARRLNFSVVLPGRLAGLGWPFRRDVPPESVVELLRETGVSVLVNLSGEPYPAAARAALAGIRLLDLPVDDFTPPSPEQVDALWALFTALPQGQALALHCVAGIGRTGTLLACLLGRERGLVAAEAVDQIRLLRPGSVETEAQEELIAEWLRARR
jgi:atypical dual specificity phosphatase